MKYTYKGRNLNIPDSEIERNVTALGVTKDEAIQIWLEDNDYEVNDEQSQLEKVATENPHKMTVSTGAEKKKRKVTKKEDVEKTNLINEIADFLKSKVENVQVTNTTKIIEFDFNGDCYKLDLIRKRKPKN